MRPVVIGLPLPLPLVGFRICCGFPSPADDWIEDAIDVSRLVVTTRRPPSCGGRPAIA